MNQGESGQNRDSAMLYLHKGMAGSPKHHPNDCQRKRSLGQLVKWGAITLLIGALTALTVWYVGYLMYEALQ